MATPSPIFAITRARLAAYSSGGKMSVNTGCAAMGSAIASKASATPEAPPRRPGEVGRASVAVFQCRQDNASPLLKLRLHQHPGVRVEGHRPGRLLGGDLEPLLLLRHFDALELRAHRQF